MPLFLFVLLLCPAALYAQSGGMSEVAGTLSAGLFSNLLKKHGIVRDRVWQLNQLVRADINPVANPEINYSDFMILTYVQCGTLDFNLADISKGMWS